MPRFSLLIAALLSLVTIDALADCRSPKNRFVHSVDDLIAHERIHARNVQELMIHTAIAFPKRYTGVAPYIVRYAEMHDLPKSDPEIAELLCRIYGLNLEETGDLTPAKRDEIIAIRRQVIDRLNDRENELKRETLIRLGLIKENGAPTSQRASSILIRLQELEKVADNVERVANPISAEEMGKVEMNAAHSFNTYLGKGASRESSYQIRHEAWTMLDHYNSRTESYNAHIAALAQDPKRGDRATVLRRILESADFRVKAAAKELSQLNVSGNIWKLTVPAEPEAGFAIRPPRDCSAIFRRLSPMN